MAAFAAAPASAATTFTVTKTADTNDGACAAGNCSLRDAVVAANATAGADTISVPAGHYTLTGAAGENAAASGDLDITEALTVNGAGASATSIDGGGTDRIFDILAPAATATLSGMTLTGGAETLGAAVQSVGPLKFDGVTVTGNRSSGANPEGAIALVPPSGATSLTIANSTVSGNTTSGTTDAYGGALFANTPGDTTVNITDSVFSSNTATTSGGSGYGTLFVHIGGVPTVNITRSRFSGNQVASTGGSDGFGGVLFYQGTGGTMTITDSTFDGNAAGAPDQTTQGFGGAVFSQSGANSALNITGSTFSSNSAGGGGQGFGGALFAQPGAGATVAVTNSTVTGNRAGGVGQGFGGGFFVQGGTTFALNSSTVASNTAGGAGTGFGGGIYDQTNTLAPKDSIVADNLEAGLTGNCQGTTTTSAGHNVENGTSCGFTGTGDQNAEPLLAPVGDYGGPTQTRALLAGSPAIDHGADCPAVDQRGQPRPFGPACDVGAYEFAPPVPTTGHASGLKTTSATLAGSLTPQLRGASSQFEFGTSTAYGTKTAAQSVGGALAPVGLSAKLTGLKAGTTYHYRLVATGDATAAGADATFTTPFPSPSLSHFKLKPSSFAAARRGASVAASPKTGTNISYTASQASKTTFRVLRAVAGRRHGRSCRRRSAKNRHARSCTLLVVVGVFSHKDKAGKNKLHFTGRVHHHALALGKYRLRATPRAHGKNGKAHTLRFKIIG